VPTISAPPVAAIPSTYVVAPGDGWALIAAKNDVRVDDLLAANHATADTVIHPNQVLVLPDAARPARPSTHAQAGTTTTTTTASRPSPTALAVDPQPQAPPAYVPDYGSGYGDISPITGKPKTHFVHDYYRKDGTHVRSHYRSR
jgi:hypothetical protein